MAVFTQYRRGPLARKRIEEIRERGRRGGKRTQELAAIARMQRTIGPRMPLNTGELLRIDMSCDVRTGDFYRAEVYRNLDRRDKRDVIVNGEWLIEGTCESEIAARRFASCKHLACIEED